VYDSLEKLKAALGPMKDNCIWTAKSTSFGHDFSIGPADGKGHILISLLKEMSEKDLHAKLNEIFEKMPVECGPEVRAALLLILILSSLSVPFSL
jgi:hypothetical protein